MQKDEFLRLWNLRKDEETEIELKDSDSFFKFDSFLFIVQSDGNVLLKKIKKSYFSIFEAFRGFRLFLIKNKIQFIRIEGNLKRYNFLSKMFPFSDFKKEENSERNIFYVKVY